MTVIDTARDTEARTLTITAELSGAPEHVWQLWADPRQLERWWGPPTWPATFTQHDVVVGGSSQYYMTGPEGERARGWWRVTSLDEPRSLSFEDGFSRDDGTPDPEMPTISVHVGLQETPTGTRMTITNSFASADEMEKLLTMGMDEGMAAAVGQIDELLASV